ncbi:hypothetical protein ACFSQ3_08485 [Sphingobacterium corticis]|uniref:Uncharacterized protein n=1 Tax=Sphingobacterium corticis TaxID=1812823 RepID=A0ABW5NM11_9SPHI
MTNKTKSILAQLKEKASKKSIYGGEAQERSSNLQTLTCPNCGAGRAKHDGLTKCAYCGFVFIDTELSKGIYLNTDDNTKS